MALKGSPMNEDVFHYLVDTFGGDKRDLLEKMKQPAEEAGLRMIMISELQADIVDVLIRTSGARRCLDIGTLFGFSAAVMARAVPEDGNVVTVERDPEAINVARQNFHALELHEKVEIKEGEAIDVIPRLEPERFDLVMVDADKQNYPKYLEEGIRLLRDGGLFLADNALAHGLVADESLEPGDDGYQTATAIREFNQDLADHPEVEATIIPAGDGLALGRYHS